MLLDEPWIFLLPEQVQSEMTQAVNKELKKYSPPRPDPPDSIFDTAEDPTSAVTELCKKLFDEADADNSGELDEEELANLTKKLFDEIGEPLPAEYKINLIGEIQKVIELNDKDGNGNLNFREFLQMLTRPPWKKLMPPLVQDNLPKVVMQLARGDQPFLPNENEENWSWDAQDQPAPEEIVEFAKTFFNEADTSENGSLDKSELETVLVRLFERLGQSDQLSACISEDQTLEEVVIHSMREFDTDGSGEIEFSEFLRMLTRRPWASLLPETLTKMLPRISNKIFRATSPVRRRPNVSAAKWAWEGSDEPPAQLVLSFAKAVFQEADIDQSGAIEQDEVATLLVGLFEQLGKPLPPEYKLKMHEFVQESMARFDADGSGGLCFPEFLRMITMKPWRDLLPHAVVDVLPKLVLKAMRAGSSEAEALEQLADDTQAQEEAIVEAVDDVMNDSREEAKQLVATARRLFDDFDTDSSGSIDQDELGNLIIELMKEGGQPLPADRRMRVVEDARASLEQFDKDGDGTISFHEFLVMIVRPPWVDLLPAEAVKQVNLLIGRFERALSPAPGARKWIWEEGSEDPAKMVFQVAMDIFSEADKDQSGGLDEDELSEVVKTLFKRLGQSLPSEFKLILCGPACSVLLSKLSMH